MSDIDIVERLKYCSDFWRGTGDKQESDRSALYGEAADTITKLRADLAIYQAERELLDQTIDKMSTDLAAAEKLNKLLQERGGELRSATYAADLASYREVFDAQKSVIGLLEDTLRKIKRENQHYNFGTKLVRLVDEALSRLPALTDGEQ